MQNEVPLDAVVDVTAGRGTVRFVGNTAFAPGKWVGIELAAPNGKNDGSVKDVVYFSCAPNHGVFVRPSQVKIVSTPGQASRPASRNGPRGSMPSTPARQSSSRSVNTRAGSPGQASPLTIRTPSNSRLPASKLPPPSPISATAARRPTLAPHKRTGSTSGAHPFAQSPLTRAQPPRTTSVQSGSTRLESDDGNGEDDEDDTITRPLEERRPSVADSEREIRHSPIESRPPISRLVVPAQSPANYPTSSPLSPSKPSVLPLASTGGNETARVPSLSKQPSRGLMLEPSSMIVRSESETMAVVPPSPKLAAPPSPKQVKEDAELRVKLRVLESKRTEDARLIPKLQALQTELSQTKRELADQQAEMSTLDEKGVEAAEQLEMAMLDKEVAEERAEAAELELESVKEKLAEIEIELQSLKEGGTPEGGGGEAKKSLDVIQLEKHNERLKEALIKRGAERKIAELERDLSGIDELQTGYEETLSKLANADAQIEDLKIQLDDALGAEEMLVQLTDRNLQLSEKIEEMRVSIEDLEALKELNDEIEENHVEAERAMQEEIDGKDSQIRELNQKIETLEETITDYEGTIVQFRELVGHMQGDMENLRQENQIHQSESSAQATQSAAILSLNMRLQSTAAKNQAKNIEFELRKLDAAQAKEWLAIVQPYLPQVYVEVDADATACYMFFQRLATKAELIANVVGSAHGLPESLSGSVPESLVGVCEMRGRMYHLACLCKRFASVLRKCDVNTFHAVGRLFPDLSPMEKRLDMHVDLLKRDEFRIWSVLAILPRCYLSLNTSQIQPSPDLRLTSPRNTRFNDATRLRFGFIRSCHWFDQDALENSIKDEDTVLEYGDLDIDRTLLEPIAQILEHPRAPSLLSSKKLVRRVEDLIQESSALKLDLVPKLTALTTTMIKGCDFGIQLAQRIGSYLADVRAQKHNFQLASVLLHVRETAAETMSQRPGTVGSWEAVGQLVAGLVKDATALMEPAMEQENILKLVGEAPWVVRIAEVKALSAVNVDAERTVNKLNEEIKDLIRSIKTRDQTIQETSVKIELMERRMETVKKQADAIKQEKAYEEALEQLQSDLDEMGQENARLKQATAGMEKHASGMQPAVEEPVIASGDLEASHLLEQASLKQFLTIYVANTPPSQIESLRGAVRFLRHENSYLKSQDLLRELNSLPPLGDKPIPVTLSRISRTSARPLTTVVRSPTPLSEVSEEEYLMEELRDEYDSEESEEAERPPSPHALATESKLLYRDLLLTRQLQPEPELQENNENEEENEEQWTRELLPHEQLVARRRENKILGRRVRGLAERAGQLNVIRL
ncbi:Dynein associated protein [Rhizoctonia solani]|uniref:Dynein associated protein n=1 Tax=Rhizoctonia solani TaxID=456999 RepID=A0A8H8T3H9_9AGAM|nr:Dynein associated protein [Rhizoctonia solani]QRW26877.1 Dynein associated protein [Rhizoctonia solani]